VSTAFVVQANFRNWEGSPDFSVQNVDGKPVVWHVVQKILTRWDGAQVVIAVPDLEENRFFAEVAAELDVKIYYGELDDVLLRIVGAAKLWQADVLVRVLGMHYFFDTELAEGMIRLHEQEAYDIVKTPDDFDIKKSVEVVSLNALERLDEVLRSSDELKDRSDIRVAPMHYMACRPDLFKVGIYEDLPVYSREQQLEMRTQAEKIYSIYNCDHIPFLPEHASNSVLLRHYEVALEYVDADTDVLDIACGDGYGSKLLASKAGRVVGVDISEEQVKSASEAYKGDGLEFAVGDATDTGYGDASFDLITSMETIEHVDDVDGYLNEMYRLLRPGGRFVISTPQNSSGEIPLIPSHLREYSLEAFKSLLSKDFEVEKIIGFKAGNLCVEGDQKGTGMMAICKKNRGKVR